MKNIEKRLIAYYAASTESAPVAISKHKAPVNEANVRRPWSKAVKTALAAILIMAILVAMPHFIKNGNINGIGVLIDDTKTEESEVETTENSAEKDDNGKESEESENNESRLIPPEGVKIVYAPNATTVIGGKASLEDERWSDADYLKCIGDAYLIENGLDSMYYVMISLYSTAERMEKSCWEYYPEDYSNGTHTFEKHLAYQQDRVNKEMALLEEYGITGLELQWPLPPETDFDGRVCTGAVYVGYVKGETLLNFENTMNEYFEAHYEHGAEFPENATGGAIYLLPEGYSAADYIFGVLSFKTPDGHWAFMHY